MHRQSLEDFYGNKNIRTAPHNRKYGSVTLMNQRIFGARLRFTFFLADSRLWKIGRKAVRMFLDSDTALARSPAYQAEFAQFLVDILDSPQVS